MNVFRSIFPLMLSLAITVLAVDGVCASQTDNSKDDSKVIYNETIDAHVEIKEALAKATAEHKRVIVVFGANWCFDCHVLDKVFHSPDAASIITASYVVVHIDIGKGEKNQDLMTKYEVPMKRGIPGVAVLDSNGKLIYSQKNGEFENARAMAPADIIAFLEKWKAGA
jgi:thioredoxin 1